ncbi:NO-inducible flavohemoprotein [Numidum massiliense]|uniref:NO-inducible flavohemoprotein n=1 Tax=Numidum massiliense TaxID=1522315 RepID=UPI0006D5B5D0|nr:NO-inducible flavohemoprotein [Numidum massiliense]
MLSARTIEIVKATAPVLEERGKEITTCFYKLMFANHPELLNIFNHTNQKLGRQQTALANAVFAAAANIDQLEAILPVVKQVGHKHRSLGVLPEHYPIVGKHLLLAMEEVLGGAASDEVIAAWTEAYDVIAGAFIEVERDMYRQAAEQSGGWADFRLFVVEKKVPESDVITSFYLKPKDGKAIAHYEPGQYISVKLNIEGEKYTHIRQYSLSAAPGHDYYRISVKREDGGDVADGVVSNYLHEQVQEGDELLLSAPAGDFVLDLESERPLVLLSGGVGLTPLVSMLHTVVARQPERPVTFVHAALNGDVHALHEEVSQLAAAHDNVSYYVCYEKPTASDREAQNYDKEGFVDLPWLQSIIRDNEADFYFCGPVPFMQAMNSALKAWGVPEERRRFEFFGPADDLEKERVTA